MQVLVSVFCLPRRELARSMADRVIAMTVPPALFSIRPLFLSSWKPFEHSIRVRLELLICMPGLACPESYIVLSLPSILLPVLVYLEVEGLPRPFLQQSYGYESLSI